MKTVLKGVAVLVTWLAWKHTASLSMCWLFWLTVLTVEMRIRQLNYGIVFLIIGTASNALVTLLNNGVMPVVGMPASVQAMFPIWHTAGAGNRMLILADHASLWYFSVGDLCMQAGCLVLLAKFVKLGPRGIGLRNDLVRWSK
ncbi:MAG: DUF5317 family protein [Candidatus Sulfotelmatobacter sp.]|jgi:hypothetical protein